LRNSEAGACERERRAQDHDGTHQPMRSHKIP
jgi:hypothetical protein